MEKENAADQDTIQGQDTTQATTQEMTLESKPTLESEINAARINALELKLETLSIITESLWNVLKQNGLDKSIDLKSEMAVVINARTDRNAATVTCTACGSEELIISGICSKCAEPLQYKGEISPFDY
ncbi:hypothetical protein [Neptuniibacter sp.]|uniref:hypothetical protein n=1 Tax=Neptuniibacter sp. TaxID=1962643 RepID=UPI00262B0022|nr:hypothetical protein [Neptuniibacter sp.]MCP4595179.1 hypothetical protein [Neptuniibacter sp.]